MSPELIQKLLAMPEIREYLAFIDGEISRLNRLDDIKLKDGGEIAIEVLARQRAAGTLTEIMRPLLSSQNQVVGRSSPNEYAVNVD